MTDRPKWWKAFLPKKKPGAKEPSFPDFDPFAQNDKSKETKSASEQVPPQSQPHDSDNNSCMLSDETYDDSIIPTYFDEQTCRRNFFVSRSGRFRQRKKVRSTLPVEDPENVAQAKEEWR
ncbi:proline-rich protein 15-like protein [Entelurus aequoreus]|uniref:proline-rich protein 15-like protein n=1 Tax=Entelurus aequoreus TaxID=161455 RepID=UPI002B1D2E77|nr:proline-rich protein 15-like protein [Entelurus aequoreus]XP_061884753.1 proline-rich protein 15-like protein [Entelurus aequoreus]